MSAPSYAQQLADKSAYLQQLFAGWALPEIAVYDSPERHFRMRAEFRIWHEGEDCCYAMFERGHKANRTSLIRLDSLPIACEAINALMPRLLAAVQAQPVLKNRLFQVEFLATLSGDMLVSLIYHKKLDEAWQAAAQALEAELDIAIIGRSRGQKWVLSRDYVLETLTVAGRTFTYRQIEGGFSQPNALVCQKMLTWACDVAEGLGGDLLELYCGNGNFTLPLATRFERVLATELAKSSVQAALWNIRHNGSDNVAIARLSAAEFTQAYRGERSFNRLSSQGIVLADYRFSTVFVDPPRAGIDDDTLALLAGFENIIYISCNPDSLHANLAVLRHSHDIKRMAWFDQFPHTHHIEAGVWLQRR